jgi:hypothetical protein
MPTFWAEKQMSEVVMTICLNSHGFWRRYRWFIVFFVTALMLDAISTVYFMRNTGSWQDEIHPVVALSSRVFGIVVGPFIGGLYKAVAAIVVTIYLKKLAAAIFTSAGVAYLLACAYNFWAVELYARNIIHWLPF